MVSRAANTVAKIQSTLIMNGLPLEAKFSQITSLDLNTLSYDLTITGIGAVSSDVNIYSSIATKIIV